MRPNKGFTLLELVIVITIIGITVGYVAPRLFWGLTTSGLDQMTRDLTTLIQYARSQAITRHKPYYVRFDFDNAVVGIYPKPESSGVTPELEKKIAIQQGVVLKGVKSPYQPKKDKGQIDLGITADGIVEQGVIYLEGGSDKVYTLQIKPFSGDFRIFDHYVEISYGG